MTLAVHVHTWLDLVTDLLRQSPQMRESVTPPLSSATQQAPIWSASITRLLGQFSSTHRDAAALAAGLRERFMNGIDPALEADMLDRSETVDLSRRIRAAVTAGSFVISDQTHEGAVLLFPGGKYVAPPTHAAALNFIASHAVFCVEDLPCSDIGASLDLAAELVTRSCLATSH